MNQIQHHIERLRSVIGINIMEGRAKSLVLTKLDELELWLIKCSQRTDLDEQAQGD